VHLYRNVVSHTQNNKVGAVARMLKAVHAQENREAALVKATEIVEKMKHMKLQKAALLVQEKTPR
jgi:putative transposase